ncbi:hypothetical protein XELAEV_18002899mg [Xenopus laevis]|nr:hypothetical protein XELAEV_18002899mg [Xenopus laevis]
MAALAIALCRFRGVGSSLLLCPSQRLTSNRKAFASKTWGKSVSETDLEWEEEEPRDITRKLKNQQKTILFQRMKRQMEPLGPPERRLAWNAIEQIRYLKQEFSEEWTVPRLAEGFNVSTEFSPPEIRKAKQDLKASNVLIQMNPQSTKHLSQPTHTVLPDAVNTAQTLIPSGQNNKLLSNTQNVNLVPSLYSVPGSGNPNSLARRSGNEVLRKNKADLQVFTKKAQVQTPKSPMYDVCLTSEEGNQAEQKHLADHKPMELDDEWDGQLLSDMDLEELSRNGTKNKMKVIQKGKEFFESNGDFLYRI